MKPYKLLAVTGLLAAGLAGSALANTTQYVYVVGAPAFRQNANDTITAVVNSYSGAGLTATSATSTSTAAIEGAKQNQWKIPNYASGVDLVINATWSGSTAGFASVASGSIPQQYIQNDTGSVASPATGAAVNQAHNPDFTLSDTFQETTVYNGTVRLQGPGAGQFFTTTYKALTPNPLGVEVYRFVASPGAAAAGLTNITTAQAQLLYQYGVLPLAFFTGKTSDEGTLVYPLSRDPGSGARLVALAETGVGAKTTIVTYKPTVTGGHLDSQNSYVNGNITDSAADVSLYPKGAISSTGTYDPNNGDTGYASFGTTTSGGGLLQAITATPPSGALFVTYLNIDDSNEAVAAGSSLLTYNGVAFNPVPGDLSTLEPVEEGNYTFWSYEQLFFPDTIAGNQLAFANQIIAEFPNHAEVPLTGLNVSRSADGGPVSQNY